MKIMIGCPVAKRDKLLPMWKEAIDNAVQSDWEVSFVFAVPSWDQATLDVISDWDNTLTIKIKEPVREDIRDWGNTDRYNHMSFLRNQLLRVVRQEMPDIYLSLDSDILIHPDAITNMYQTLIDNEVNAVGGLTYLDPTDRHCNSFAFWKNTSTMKSFLRVRDPGVHKVDVIMAIKMMDNLAYNVNYEFHDCGEDFGWAKNMNITRAQIFCDGRVASKHIMCPGDLDRIDKRVGY